MYSHDDFLFRKIMRIAGGIVGIVVCVIGWNLIVKPWFVYKDALEKARESNAYICDKYISTSFFGHVYYYVQVEYDVEPALLEEIPWYLDDDIMQEKIQVTEGFYNACKVGDSYIE